MKWGIITFHQAINYGAVLQACGLVTYLNKLGVDASVIDYRNSTMEEIYSPKKISIQFTPLGIVKYFLKNRYKKITYEKFKIFLSNYCALSTKSYGENNIHKANSQYDLFLVGSDQVWNYKGHNFDKNYFLDFVQESNKKYSYAASFGLKTIPIQLRQQYHNLLMDFSCFSVREEQGSEILKNELNFLNKRIIVSIDPALLIDSNTWKKIAIKPNNTMENKYILVYSFGITDCMLNFINFLAIKELLPVYQITDDFKITPGIKNLKGVGPQEFIYLIMNATYVVTNSFHGTAFSINFNKQFFVELLSEKTLVNSRLENILKLFNLKKRLIEDGQCLDIDNNIDFNNVNIVLEKEREASSQYFKSILENNNE